MVSDSGEPHTQSVSCEIKPPLPNQTVLFDASHGQTHWAQTGFSSREMHTNFVSVLETLCQQGCHCVTSNGQSLSEFLVKARLLVIPPPTGKFDPQQQRWLPQATALFTTREIRDILAFLQNGGRLLAFSYRFGDSFTCTNLRDLVAPLGCLINNDVVIDLPTLRTAHPLQAHFDTPREALPLAWSQAKVQTVRWRAMATFTILPGAGAAPLVLSPGGRCLCFDRVQRRISFASQPIAVAGCHGGGRYLLFGGPHAFEKGAFGLFNAADNAQFLQNILDWLLSNEPEKMEPGAGTAAARGDWLDSGLADRSREWSQVEGQGSGQQTVAFVERMLRRTGILKALARARWMP